MNKQKWILFIGVIMVGVVILSAPIRGQAQAR